MEPMVMLKRGTVLPASVVEEILTSAAAACAEAPNRALKRRVRQRLHKKLGSMLTAEEFEKAMDRYSAMEDEASSHLSQASVSPSSSGPSAPSPCTVMLPNLGTGNSANMCPANPVTACQTFIAVPMMPLITTMPVPQQPMGQMQPTLQPMLQPMQPVQPMGPFLQPAQPAQPMQAMQVQPMPAPAMMQLLRTDAPAPSPKAQNVPVDEISEDISQTASTTADNDGENTDDDEDDLESISELSTEWVRAVSQGSSECPVERTSSSSTPGCLGRTDDRGLSRAHGGVQTPDHPRSPASRKFFLRMCFLSFVLQ
ncbi:unnamed protein product [Symbiodinium sp. CCMP2456]|nr:unnamed protein product [Symbiodinium sp. CCMP2456]